MSCARLRAATRSLSHPMSVLLAIDTAAPRLQLALLRDDDRVDTLVEDMAHRPGRAAVPGARRAAGARRHRLRRSHPHRRHHRPRLVHRPPHRPQRRARPRPRARHPGDRRPLAARALARAPAATPSPCCSMPGATRPISRPSPAPAFRSASRRCCRWTRRARRVPHGAELITSPFVDIAALARFAATADPALYPPEADLHPRRRRQAAGEIPRRARAGAAP